MYIMLTMVQPVEPSGKLSDILTMLQRDRTDIKESGNTIRMVWRKDNVAYECYESGKCYKNAM